MRCRGRRISRGALGLILLATCLFAAARRAAAQGASSATLGGTVVDASGGVLPEVDVTLVSARTGARRSATTGPAGTYAFVALLPGDYRLRVEKAGFAPWESGELHLSPGDSLDLEARLKVAARAEQIEVTAERAMVRADQGAREGLITAPQIQNLSIISRGAMELLRILPGTVAPDQTGMEKVGFTFGGVNSLGDYSVNGNRGTQMSPVLDGSKIVDFGSNATVMLNMNPDMVEEVKIQTGNYAAEYGSPSIQISAVTKGGSSRFHGSVYDYWRNWRLNANDRSNSYAGIPRPKSDYQYPGFNLSGPVLVPGTGFNKNRDKLFFFVGYEYQRQIIDPGTTLGVVPTAAQRKGDFSELLTGTGQNLGQLQAVTIPWGFPGAGEPAPKNDLSPYVDQVGQAYMTLYPLPNYADPDNRYNYAFSTPKPVNRWQLSSRLDWNVSQATRAYVRFALEREDERSERGGCYGVDYSTFALPFSSVNGGKSWSVAANVSSVLGSNLTNEIVFSASQLKLDYDWEDPSKVSRSALGLDDYHGVFPDESATAPIEVTSSSQNQGQLTAAGFPVYAHNDTVSFADTLTKATNTHVIKLGVFVERGQKQEHYGTARGTLGLGGLWNPTGTGNDYGDLLVGRPGWFYQQTYGPHGRFRFWNFEGFAQDSWKVRRNFTLEAGLRVAKLPNNEELTGLAMRFEPSAYDDSQGAFVDGDPQRPNGVLLASRGEIPNGITRSPGVLFMPRLNFAWDLRSNGDWRLRGGGGLFYNRPPGGFQYSVMSQPPNAFNIFLFSWDVPGGLTIPSLPAIDPWSRLGAGYADSADPNSIHLPRTWSWSVALAKRLPWRQAFEVAYVGNRADHLPNATLINYVPPGALTGSYGNADLDNPLHRAALDSSVVAAFRTYPAYSNNSWWYQYEGWSGYHAFQATLSRTAGRLQYFLNYTFSKALGTTGNDYALLDPIDPGQRSHGVLLQDRTHIFNASYNALLPDPIRTDGNALLRGALNGWQVSGITSYRSGRPFRVYFTGELTTDPMLLAWWETDAHRAGNYESSGAITPVFAGDPRTGRTGTGEKILDISKLAIPAVGESGPFQQPYDFRAPSVWSWDLTLFKSFSLGRDGRLQFRVGVFNLFNQAAPNVSMGDIDLNLAAECNVRVDGVPNGAGGYADGVCDPTQGFHFSDLTKQNFGKIITKRGHRVIELALRFDF
jgi:hypothetical protein